MRVPGTQSSDDDPPDHFIPAGPTYRPPVVLIGAAMWTLAIATIGTLVMVADFSSIETFGVDSVGTILRAFAGVAVFVVLFPLIAHIRLRFAASD